MSIHSSPALPSPEFLGEADILALNGDDFKVLNIQPGDAAATCPLPRGPWVRRNRANGPTPSGIWIPIPHGVRVCVCVAGKSSRELPALRPCPRPLEEGPCDSSPAADSSQFASYYTSGSGEHGPRC